MADSQSREVFFLKQVSNQKYSEDFAQNMVQVNTTIQALSKYLISMQKGIDDLNRDIIEVVQDFIDEVIIFFGGGAGGDSGFEFGDLKYIFQAIGGLFGFPNLAGNNKAGAANNFFTNFLAPLDGFKSAIRGFFDILFGFLEDVPFVGDVIESIANAMNKTQQTASTAISEVKTVASQVATTVEIINVISSRPLHDGLDPTAEGTLRWADLGFVGNNTNSVDGSSSHSHTIAYDDWPAFTINATTARGGILRSGYNQQKRVLTFVAQKVGTVNSVNVDVYKKNEDGSYNVVWSSPDIAPDMAFTWSWNQVVLPDDVGSEDGDVWAFQIRMVGSGSVQAVGKRFLNPQFLNAFRPSALGFTRNPTVAPGAAPASFTMSQFDSYYSGDVIYFEWGGDVGQTNLPRNWFDAANRTTGIGSNWLLRSWSSSGNLGITDNRFAFQGGSDGFQYALWGLPMATDKIQVEVDFIDVVSRESGLVICANSNLNNFVLFDMTSGTMGIVTCGSADVNSGTIRVSGNPNINRNGRWVIQYDPATNRYSAFRKDNPTVEVMGWTDSGNYVTHGKGKRFVGMFIGRAAFGNGSVLDNWEARDY